MAASRFRRPRRRRAPRWFYPLPVVGEQGHRQQYLVLWCVEKLGKIPSAATGSVQVALAQRVARRPCALWFLHGVLDTPLYVW